MKRGGVHVHVTVRSLVMLLLLALSFPGVCHCFTTWTASGVIGPSSLFSSSTSSEEEAPNLYLILGASPKDSDAEIKRKWQQLARRLHPDANVNVQRRLLAQQEGQGTVQQGEDNYPFALSDVNAAWGVLSDPKERRRYDRALQAREMADTFEILLDAGIKTAIPFFRKTADGAVKLGEQSGKTLEEVSKTTNQVMNDVNMRMRINAQIYDLETDARETEKKATNAKTRIQRLRNQLQNQKNQQLESLKNPDTLLSSQEAIRLLNKFVGMGNNGVTEFTETNVEINYLEELEFQLKDYQKFHQSAIRSLTTAQKQANDAIAAEQVAEDRWLQAQRDLAEAQARNLACRKAQFEAAQVEKEALLDAQTVSAQLNQQTQKVKYQLRIKESESLARQAQLMQQQIQQLEYDQLEYQRQAEALKVQVKSLRQQQ